MATKKTKNAKNAPEYIDSAGVKLNANSDLIIEATKDGDVISARNLLNNTEYVGGGSGGGIFYIDATTSAPITLNKTFAQIYAAYNEGLYPVIRTYGEEGGLFELYLEPVTGLANADNYEVVTGILHSDYNKVYVSATEDGVLTKKYGY